MSLENLSAESRPEINLTSSSTLHHLIGVAITCSLLWALIAITISV